MRKTRREGPEGVVDGRGCGERSGEGEGMFQRQEGERKERREGKQEWHILHQGQLIFHLKMLITQLQATFPDFHNTVARH